MKALFKRDSFNRIQYTYFNNSDFMYNYTNFEYDNITNRYYQLDEIGDRLKKRRISKQMYNNMLLLVKQVFDIQD